MTKTISCSQMAKVLGRTTTSIRECIARDKFSFAQCWQTEGKKGRTFDIDKEGFKNFLLNNLGWSKAKVDSEFKGADIYE